MDTPKPEPEQESRMQAFRKVEIAAAALVRAPHRGLGRNRTPVARTGQGRLLLGALRWRKSSRCARIPAATAHERDEVLSGLGLRLARALARGLVIESFEAFLRRVLLEEVIHLRRKWGRERKRARVVGSASDVPAESEAEAGCDLSEKQVRGLADSLPSPYGKHLCDLLAGRPDAEIAARDGVEESAVRKRWSRLLAYFLQKGMLEKIMDFLVTKGGAPAPLGMGGESFAPRTLPPPPPGVQGDQVGEYTAKVKCAKCN